MQNLTRQLVSLDMLCLELADFDGQQTIDHLSDTKQEVTHSYLILLQQFYASLQKLSETASAYNNYQFAGAVAQSGSTIQFKNKRMLLVYLKLLGYIIEFYQLSHKILAIRDSHFDDHAEARLQLLYPRMIKAKAQFKTVVQALGKKDYQMFATSLALPLADWAWDVLRLD